jgi:hypothetical protein
MFVSHVRHVRQLWTAVTQDVLLVLVLRTGNNNNIVPFEAPLDPARALTVFSVRPSLGAPRRRYVFHATRDDAEFALEPPNQTRPTTLSSSTASYLTDLCVQGELLQSQSAPPARVVEETVTTEDLRGQFVLMNEDDGDYRHTGQFGQGE